MKEKWARAGQQKSGCTYFSWTYVRQTHCWTWWYSSIIHVLHFIIKKKTETEKDLAVLNVNRMPWCPAHLANEGVKKQTRTMAQNWPRSTSIRCDPPMHLIVLSNVHFMVSFLSFAVAGDQNMLGGAFMHSAPSHSLLVVCGWHSSKLICLSHQHAMLYNLAHTAWVNFHQATTSSSLENIWIVYSMCQKVFTNSVPLKAAPSGPRGKKNMPENNWFMMLTVNWDVKKW